MVTPLISSAIESAVKAAVDEIKTGVLDQLIGANTKLQEVIDKQSKTLEEQNSLIQSQAKVLHENLEQINELKVRVDALSLELVTIKTSTNDIEQYGRRNSLRFINLNVDATAPEPDLTKEVVGFVNQHVLKDGQQISVSDIDRCHPVGNGNRNGTKTILVKFFKYHTKNLVFSSKSSLRLNPAKVFITEDLTRSNFEMVGKLQLLRRNGHIHSYWTFNGRVYAKKYEKSDPIHLLISDNVKSRLQIDAMDVVEPS